MRIKYLVTLAFLAGAMPATSHAQLGGLIKKAKEATDKKVADNANVKPSDAFGPELDQSTLASLLRGLSAMASKGEQRDGLRKQQEGLAKRLNDSRNEHQKEQAKFDSDRSATNNCISASLQKSNQAHQAAIKANPGAMAASQMTPEAMADQAKFAQQMQDLMKKNDTAGIRKLSQQQGEKMNKAMGIDMHADSAAAIKVCGAPPARPGWMVDEDNLRAQIDKLNEQIRSAELDMQTVGMSASGMPAAQFAQARERVVNWYAEDKSGHAVQRFGDSERKMFESHRADIARVSKAL